MIYELYRTIKEAAEEDKTFKPMPQETIDQIKAEEQARQEAAQAERQRQRDEELRIRNEKHRVVKDKMKEVLGLLGFEVDWESEESSWRPAVSGKKADGTGLSFEEEGGRIWITGENPDGKYVKVYDTDHKEVENVKISVKSEKSSQQIAADIKRRLLPDYLRRFELAKKKIAEEEAYKNLVIQNIKTLTGKDPSEQEIRDGMVRYFGLAEDGDAMIRVGGEWITLELRSINMDQAKKVMDLLRKKK